MSEVISRTVGPKGAKKSLRKAFKNQRPVFLWGPPGIGKSDIIQAVGCRTRCSRN
jgi:MoxR-like ATPase